MCVASRGLSTPAQPEGGVPRSQTHHGRRLPNTAFGHRVTGTRQLREAHTCPRRHCGLCPHASCHAPMVRCWDARPGSRWWPSPSCVTLPYPAGHQVAAAPATWQLTLAEPAASQRDEGGADVVIGVPFLLEAEARDRFNNRCARRAPAALGPRPRPRRRSFACLREGACGPGTYPHLHVRVCVPAWLGCLRAASHKEARARAPASGAGARAGRRARCRRRSSPCRPIRRWSASPRPGGARGGRWRDPRACARADACKLRPSCASTDHACVNDRVMIGLW